MVLRIGSSSCMCESVNTTVFSTIPGSQCCPAMLQKKQQSENTQLIDPVFIYLHRMNWLACALLLCSSAVAQLHRDPTLDSHWTLWKKTYSKEYREKVQGLASHQLAFPYIPCTFSSSKLCFQRQVFNNY